MAAVKSHHQCGENYKPTGLWEREHAWVCDIYLSTDRGMWCALTSPAHEKKRNIK